MTIAYRQLDKILSAVAKKDESLNAFGSRNESRSKLYNILRLYSTSKLFWRVRFQNDIRDGLYRYLVYSNKSATKKYAFWLKLMTSPLLMRFLVRGIEENQNRMPRWTIRYINPMIHDKKIRPRLVSFYLVCGIISPEFSPLWKYGYYLSERIGLTRQMLIHGGSIEDSTQLNETRLYAALNNRDLKAAWFLLTEGADPENTSKLIARRRIYQTTPNEERLAIERYEGTWICWRMSTLGLWEEFGWYFDN